MSLPSGQAPTDLDLIGRIKTANDSAAVSELVHRHTGIYINVINEFEAKSSYFRQRANVPDLKEDKFVNIYQWALKYEPDRETVSGKPMQFGSYVGEMAKYLCKSQISHGTENVEFNEAISVSNEASVTDAAERDSAIESVREQVAAIDEGILDRIAEKQEQANKLLAEIVALEDDLLNKRVFKEIFNMRYSAKKPLVWRDIAKKVGMTHEGARKLFNKHMELIKERAAD